MATASQVHVTHARPVWEGGIASRGGSLLPGGAHLRQRASSSQGKCHPGRFFVHSRHKGCVR
eukprot:5696066-Amphidinium_carterae.1